MAIRIDAQLQNLSSYIEEEFKQAIQNKRGHEWAHLAVRLNTVLVARQDKIDILRWQIQDLMGQIDRKNSTIRNLKNQLKDEE
jgi:uncharacterized protein involved in exopolysaccharide biosynthesis